MVKMGYVWDRTTEFLGDHLALLLPIVILGLFVPTSISGSLDSLRPTAGPGLKLGLGLVSLAFGILSLWVQLAIAALAIDATIGKRMTAVATARLVPAIGVFLLVLIAVVLLCVPIGFLMIAGGFDIVAAQAGQVTGMDPAYGFALVVYVFVLMLVLLFCGARLMPLTAVIVNERRGLGAIARTWRLTRGMTWRLVGVVVLYAVVALVAILAAQTVFGSILRIFAGGEGPFTIAAIVTAIVVAAVSTGFTTLAAAFAAKLYVTIVGTPEAVGTPAATPYPDIDAVLS